MSSSANIIRYTRTRLPLVACVVWLLAIFILYTFVHNPLQVLGGVSIPGLLVRVAAAFAQQGWPGLIAQAIGLNLLDVMAVIALVGLSGAAGTVLLPARESFLDFERPLLEVLLGLGLVSLLVLLLGLIGLFPPRWVAWAIPAALAVIFRKPLIAWYRDLMRAVQGLLSADHDQFARWLHRCIIVLLLLPLLVVLLPPTKWDALTYHLAGPKLYLETGRVIGFPENHFLGFPQIAEMLYLWLMIAARPQAAALLHWAFGCLAVLLTLALGQRTGRSSAGAIAAIGLLACDSLWGEFASPYNDLALIAFVMAALIAVFTWAGATSARHDRVLILVGVYLGLAMGTKYTAVGLALGIAALVAWITRAGGIRQILRACGMVSITALAVFAPWMLKDTILYGNPIAPFVWGTPAFDHFDQTYYLRPGTGLDAASVILAPIQGTVFGQEGKEPYGGSTGALAFTLLPLTLIGWKRRSQADRDFILALGVFVVPPYLVWVAGIATSWYLVQTRLLYPIFPALLLMGGLGAQGRDSAQYAPNPVSIGRIIALAAGVIAVWVSAVPTLLGGNWLTVLGLEPQEKYLAENLGDYALAMAQINALPARAKVQFLWEPATFYCNRQCIPDSLLDEWWHDRQLEPDPHRIVAGWRAQGITYLLISERGLRFLTTEERRFELLSRDDLTQLDSARRSDLIPVWDTDGGYTLYRIRDAAP